MIAMLFRVCGVTTTVARHDIALNVRHTIVDSRRTSHTISRPDLRVACVFLRELRVPAALAFAVLPPRASRTDRHLLAADRFGPHAIAAANAAIAERVRVAQAERDAALRLEARRQRAVRSKEAKNETPGTAKQRGKGPAARRKAPSPSLASDAAASVAAAAAGAPIAATSATSPQGITATSAQDDLRAAVQQAAADAATEGDVVAEAPETVVLARRGDLIRVRALTLYHYLVPLGYATPLPRIHGEELLPVRFGIDPPAEINARSAHQAALTRLEEIVERALATSSISDGNPSNTDMKSNITHDDVATGQSM